MFRKELMPSQRSRSPVFPKPGAPRCLGETALQLHRLSLLRGRGLARSGLSIKTDAYLRRRCYCPQEHGSCFHVVATVPEFDCLSGFCLCRGGTCLRHRRECASCDVHLVAGSRMREQPNRVVL